MLKLTKAIVLFSLFFVANKIFAQATEEEKIKKVLINQQNSWNNASIELFMQGYWKSDSLIFIGKKGITYGWENTLNNYKRNYPDAKAMGKLTFVIVKTELTSNKTAFIIGKWELEKETATFGYFLLQLKKINGDWKIIADHTS